MPPLTPQQQSWVSLQSPAECCMLCNVLQALSHHFLSKSLLERFYICSGWVTQVLTESREGQRGLADHVWLMMTKTPGIYLQRCVWSIWHGEHGQLAGASVSPMYHHRTWHQDTQHGTVASWRRNIWIYNWWTCRWHFLDLLSHHLAAGLQLISPARLMGSIIQVDIYTWKLARKLIGQTFTWEFSHLL